MKKTKIEWCDSTWNPITGCLHECPYCYANKIASRFGGSIETCPDGTLHELEEKFYADPSGWIAKDGESLFRAYPWGFDPTFHKYRLNEPKSWTEPRNIFVCSMADLFGEWVPDEWIEEVFKACDAAPKHNYLFLTKNPARYIELYIAGKLPMQGNMWYGTTIINPDSPYVFCETKSHNLFLSVEPIMEDMGELYGISDDKNIKWVIVGAETGYRKGRITPEKSWIDNLAEQCSKYDVPIFMKDSLVPIVGEENMRREFPAGLRKTE